MTAPTMIYKSVFAMAAIRSCGGAFVANAPRRHLGVGIGSSALRTKHVDSVIQLNYLSKSNKPAHLPIISLRGISLRALSSATPLSAMTPLQPLVVCGPSGVGKGTIISRFMEARQQNNNAEKSKSSGSMPKFGFSVSHTTRQPRPGEVDGVHYHFVTRDFMLDKIESSGSTFFIEHAEVHGNLYGTSFQSIFDVSNVVGSNSEEITDISSSIDNQQCLLDIDVEGVKSIKEFQSRQQEEMRNEPIILGKERSTQQYLTNKTKSIPDLDAKFIFIAPPSVDVLRERLAGRGTETPETLERRFQNAKAELEYGYSGNFDAIIVNDNLDRACEEFEKVVKEMYHVR